MAKVTNNPKEKMRMNIELADNGIIIRNPDEEDEVTIAQTALNFHEKDNINEYQAIGKKIYDWLLDVVIQEHTDFINTNFDIDITATCKGRPFNE